MFLSYGCSVFLNLFSFSELPVYIEHLCVVSSFPLAACCSGGLTTVIRALVCFNVLFLQPIKETQFVESFVESWFAETTFFFKANGINVLFHCIFLESLVFEETCIVTVEVIISLRAGQHSTLTVQPLKPPSSKPKPPGSHRTALWQKWFPYDGAPTQTCGQP